MPDSIPDTSAPYTSAQPPGNDRDSQLPPSLFELLFRWSKRAIVAGLAISIITHVVFLVVSTMIWFGGGGGSGTPGTGEGAGGGSTGLALVSGGQLGALQAESVELATVGVLDSELSDETSASDLDGPSDAGLSSTGSLSGGLAGGGGDLGSGAGIGTGMGDGLGGGSGTGANFFGVEAQGNRFAYIVDVSGSMGFGGKMDALKAQLLRSVDALSDTTQFVVYTFSDGAEPIGGKKTWSEASGENKRWARRHISALSDTSGTNPLPAFQLVLALRPRPDAIYFMTDGVFDRPDDVKEIAKLNRSPKIPIHCISLLSPEAEDIMREIAKTSGGKYTLIDSIHGGKLP